MSGEEGRLLPRITPEEWIAQAKERWNPVTTVCLFSGGNDSSVLAARCKPHYNHLLYIDTGLAVPGVKAHVRQFAEWLGKPVVIRHAGDAYREMVLGELGFPGKGQHRRAYNRLKERQIEAELRTQKSGEARTASVLFLSGIRRAESQRRRERQPLTERFSAKYCNPLIEWTDEEMHRYRAENELPESDVAALLHRSGECNCGAFANAEDERAMLKSLWPDWWANTIESLEREAEEKGIRWCRWGGYDLNGIQAAGSDDDEEAGLLCSDCPSRLFDPAVAA